MSVINITEEQMKRFQRIRESRPQDSKARDTFDYILRVYEEIPLRVVTPATLADKLYADKQRKVAQDLALKAANAAPMKNNTYKERKE
jgi:hypothetical protein